MKDTDQYGRAVGVVYLGATDMNLATVRLDYAWWHKKYAPFCSELRDAQQQARAEGLVWADPNPLPPWEWRQEAR